MTDYGHFPTGGRVKTDWYVRVPWRNMRLVEPLKYIDKRGTEWVAEADTIINGASVPWFFRRLFPVYIGFYRRPSVLHDAACESRSRPSWKVHRMFHDAMRCEIASRFESREYTTPPGRCCILRKALAWWLRARNQIQYDWQMVQAWLLWAAVRVFGPRF